MPEKEYNNKLKHIQYLKKGIYTMNKDLYSKISFEQSDIKIELYINHIYPDNDFGISLYKDNEYQCYIDMPIFKCIAMLNQFGLTDKKDIESIAKLHFAGSTQDIYACINTNKIEKCKDKLKDTIISGKTINLSDTEISILHNEYKERYSYDEYLSLSPELQNYYYLCNPYNNKGWHLPKDTKYIITFINKYKHLITDITLNIQLESDEAKLNLDTVIDNEDNLLLKTEESIAYKTYTMDEIPCNIIKFDELDDTFKKFFGNIDSSKYIDIAVSMNEFKSTLNSDYIYNSYHHKLNDNILKKQKEIIDKLTSSVATSGIYNSISISNKDREIINLKHDLFNTTPEVLNYTQVKSYVDIRTNYTDYTMQNKPKAVSLDDLLRLVIHILSTK